MIAGPNTYEAEGKSEQKIIDIDCRGLEFTEFKPDVSPTCRSFSLLSKVNIFPPILQRLTTKSMQGEWEAKGVESSTPFTSVDLSEGEWYDYDEKAGEEVSIREVKFDFRRA